MVAEVKALPGCLRKVARETQQEISKRISSLSAIEAEGAIEGGVWIFVDLVVVKLKPDFERMHAENLGNRIVEKQRVVPLLQIGNRHAHDKGREHYIFHPFKLRRLHHDSATRSPGHKTLRLQGNTQAATWLPDVVYIAEEADVKLVHRPGV